MTKKIDIYIVIESEVDNGFNDIFMNVHEKLSTKSGDISPEQLLALNSIKDQLISLIIEHVEQNK